MTDFEERDPHRQRQAAQGLYGVAGEDMRECAPLDNETNGRVMRPIVAIWAGDEPLNLNRRELVDSLLPLSGTALLSGQSGAGKTFIALELAGCLSIGTEFFGHEIDECGGTALLIGEGEGTIAERIAALRDRLGTNAPPIVRIAVTESLSNLEHMAATAARIQQLSSECQNRFGYPIRLVVVDTLAATFALKDENDASETTAAMKALDGLAKATDTLVLAVAHYGKNAETGVRGSSALTASADAILAACAERDSKGKVTSRTLSLTKSRYRDTGWTTAFETVSVHIGDTDKGKPVFSAVVNPLEMVKAKKERPFPPMQTLLIKSFHEAIGDYGIDWQIPNGGKLRAVAECHVREIYYSRQAEKPNETQRKNWNTSIKGLLDRTVLVAASNNDGERVLWLNS